MRVTNTSRETIDLVVSGKAKNGVPPTESIAPGETKDVDVDVNEARFQGYVLAGSLSVPAGTASKVEAAATEPTASTRK